MKIEAKSRLGSVEVVAGEQTVVSAIMKGMIARKVTPKKIVMDDTVTLAYGWDAGPDDDELRGAELAKYFVGDLKVSAIREVHSQGINVIHFTCESCSVMVSLDSATVTVVSR